ncbi:TetR/AcrR family transcriptional regulator C-terminal domain-containing protein [Streptomyces sp. XY332]|uniref:TetR/AcrR family transcriptional regulator C-terminal domain-containing protein n=1 Tax=Streptomyces sp. XY332 TaxID=1415561 RepID=UPI0006B1B5E3|nr:TetR/AcrR family transcriptional regulator C-terminal domain-containing protein [Streptomyces sp. XY332]KOY53236.1 transcriptional regulator [Streptomyces sp. XY332]
MTKKQEGVVRAALELLDDRGAEAVSIRGVADRLGVRMNTVLWHAKSKARLLELMADAIVAEVSLADLPGQWQERVRELARRYRRALLSHRDGAVIVAGTHAAEPGTLSFADTMVEALLSGGLDERAAAWTCWTIVYFVLGLAQEEQTAARADGDDLVDALAPGGYPALSRVVAHLRDASFDERFEYGLGLMTRQ